MLNVDVMYNISNFFSAKELFIFSAVTKEWREIFLRSKKKFISKKIKSMQITHLCNNVCPCFLENFFPINQFDLDKQICDYLNSKYNWIKNYIE